MVPTQRGEWPEHQRQEVFRRAKQQLAVALQDPRGAQTTFKAKPFRPAGSAEDTQQPPLQAPCPAGVSAFWYGWACTWDLPCPRAPLLAHKDLQPGFQALVDLGSWKVTHQAVPAARGTKSTTRPQVPFNRTGFAHHVIISSPGTQLKLCFKGTY